MAGSPVAAYNCCGVSSSGLRRVVIMQVEDVVPDMMTAQWGELSVSAVCSIAHLCIRAHTFWIYCTSLRRFACNKHPLWISTWFLRGRNSRKAQVLHPRIGGTIDLSRHCLPGRCAPRKRLGLMNSGAQYCWGWADFGDYLHVIISASGLKPYVR
jgi:hypothetical protein